MQSSVFLVGKLVHRQEDVRTLPAGTATSSPLVYLQDSLSRRFLIDSGASVSVFPDPLSSSTSSGVRLLTADGSSLTYLLFFSNLYHGPYLVLEQRSKFFRLQIGQKVDSVSVDRLKPVFSDSPVVPANPPPRGRPPLHPARQPPEPSSAVNSSSSKKKSVTFLNMPTVMLRRNPYRQARGRSTCSTLTPTFLLGGSNVVEDDLSLCRIQRCGKKSFNSAKSSWYIFIRYFKVQNLDL